MSTGSIIGLVIIGGILAIVALKQLLRSKRKTYIGERPEDRIARARDEVRKGKAQGKIPPQIQPPASGRHVPPGTFQSGGGDG